MHRKRITNEDDEDAMEPPWASDAVRRSLSQTAVPEPAPPHAAKWWKTPNGETVGFEHGAWCDTAWKTSGGEVAADMDEFPDAGGMRHLAWHANGITFRGDNYGDAKPHIVFPTHNTSWSGTMQTSELNTFEAFFQCCGEGNVCADCLNKGECSRGMLCNRCHVQRVPTYGEHLPPQMAGLTRKITQDTDGGLPGPRVDRRRATGAKAERRKPQTLPSGQQVLTVQNTTGVLNPCDIRVASHTREATICWRSFPNVPPNSRVLFKSPKGKGGSETL